MGFLRSQVVGSIKWVLARQGGVLVSTSRFGIYPFADVKRLAAVWKYPVTTIFDVGASEGESTWMHSISFRRRASWALNRTRPRLQT